MSLADVYGGSGSEAVADETFLQDAGNRGWVVLTQNFRMWRVPAERQAILSSNTRVFSLGKADLPLIAKGLVFGRYFGSIRKRGRREDPCFWRLHLSHVNKDLR